MVTKRLQYRYDAVGNKVGMTDADGGLFTYTYDVMRRLTGVINPLGERTTYVYDLNGRRTSAQLANGTRTSYSYDQGSRVQQIHTLKSNNSTVAKFDYAYDNNGRRTSVLEADGSRVTWTYDGTSQVTSEWRTGTSPFRHTFVYDTRGNRTLKIEDGARTTLVYDAANQLSSSEDAGGTTNYTYDANGNQHVTATPGGSRTTQVWDYENRLVKTLQPSGGVSTMAYDADGLRVRKETPSEAKLVVWDDQNYLTETDDSGVTEVAYTTEPSTYGSTISHRTGGATTTYHFDALAAARVLTNASETVLESYNYTAFGTILGTPTLLTPFLWGGLVGYYWDADLGSQYIRARHYQPSIARWISLDPIGFAGGDSNLFRYVGNSPTSGATERRVRLSASAYSQFQLNIAPTTLDYLSITRNYDGRKGGHLSDGMIRYANGKNIYVGWFPARSLDPNGFQYIYPGVYPVDESSTAVVPGDYPIYSRGNDDTANGAEPQYETALLNASLVYRSTCQLKDCNCVGEMNVSMRVRIAITGSFPFGTPDDYIIVPASRPRRGWPIRRFSPPGEILVTPFPGLANSSYPNWGTWESVLPLGRLSCKGGALARMYSVTPSNDTSTRAVTIWASVEAKECGRISGETRMRGWGVPGRPMPPLIVVEGDNRYPPAPPELRGGGRKEVIYRTRNIYCSLATIACVCLSFALGWRTCSSSSADQAKDMLRQNGACDGTLKASGARELLLSVDGEKWAITSASPIEWSSVDECRVLKASKGRTWLVLLVKTVTAEETVFWCGFVSENTAINATEGATADHLRGRLSVDFLECGRGTPDAKILAASTDFYDLFLVYGQTIQHRFISGGVCTVENLPVKPFVRQGKCSVEYGAITYGD